MARSGLRLPKVLPFGAFIKSMKQTKTSTTSRGVNIIDTELSTGEHIPIVVHNGAGYDVVHLDVDDDAGRPASATLTQSEETDASTGEVLQALSFAFHKLCGTIIHIAKGDTLDAGAEPNVTVTGDEREATATISLPAPWDISLDVNATALAAGTPPTAQLIPSHSGNTKHWTLELGLSTGEQGIQGEQGVQGEQGIQGERGIDGKTGRTPIITITAGEHYGEYGTPSITQTTADNGDTTITLDYMRGPSMDEFVAPPVSAGVEGAIWIE